jgi:hypothetical protein
MSLPGDEQDPKRLMEKVPQEPITADNPSEEDDQDEDEPEKEDERSRGGQA